MLKTLALRVAVGAALALSLAACDPARQALLEQDPELSRPYALDRYLYYLDHRRSRLLVVDPTGEGELIIRTEAMTEPSSPVILPAPEDGGRRAMALLEPGAHRLVVVDESWDGDRNRTVVTLHRLPLSQLYDRVDVSPDGRYLLVTYRGNVASRDFITVASKVAVVDLAAVYDGEGAAAVQEQALDLESSPSWVALSGPLYLYDEAMPTAAPTCEQAPAEAQPMHDADRHVAMLVTEGRMALLDLDNPTLRPPTLVLDPGVRPGRLLFAPDPQGRPRVLFTKAGTQAIVSLTLSLSRTKHMCVANEQDSELPELVVDYVELSAEVMPGDMAGLEGAGGLPTLVAPATNRPQASVLELRGSMLGATLPLEAAVSRVVRLQGSDGRDVALMYAGNGSERRVTMLRVVDAEGEPSMEVTYSKPFDAPVASVETVPGNRTRVLLHLQRTPPTVEVLDIDTGRATAAVLAGQPSGSVFSAAGSELFLVAQRSQSGDNYLVSLSLGAEHALGSAYMLLDHEAASVSLLEAAGLVVVDHGEPSGRVTVVPAHDLRREAAWMLDGIYLHGILEEGR